MTIQQNYPAIKPSLNLDFANTKQLDPRITYSRASTGTYYDGKTVAKAEENLLTYSQDFVSWTEANGCTVTADSTAAPDGTTTADLLIPSTASLSYHVRTSNSFTTQAASILSVYVKPSGYNYLSVVVSSNTGRANIEVSTGSITNYGTNAFTVNSIALANGWYRLVITVPVAFSAANVWLGPNSAVRDPLAIWAGDGTSGAYLWGAQLEQRSFATAYTPTTTAPITNYIPVLQTASAGTPRFDHNPITGESLGLLIEEQRTNLLLRSNAFTTSPWSIGGTPTLVANAVTAPDGTVSGWSLTTSANNILQSVAVTSGSEYTLSLYVKQGNTTFIGGEVAGAAAGMWSLNFSTLAVTVNNSISNGSVTNVGNGWYRVSMKITASATGSLTIFQYGSQNFGSTGTAYIWGAQLEAGAFATSYIPTVASQVTRAADSASMTGTNFSSWYNQSEGSVYADIAKIGSNTFAFDFSDNTTNNRTYHRLLAQQQTIVAISNGANQCQIYDGTAFNTFAAKVTFGYKLNDFVTRANGGASATTEAVDAFGAIPVVDRVHIGCTFAATGQINGTIKKLAYYNRRLTNTQLQALTS